MRFLFIFIEVFVKGNRLRVKGKQNPVAEPVEAKGKW
jgi:hypothetical protein